MDQRQLPRYQAVVALLCGSRRAIMGICHLRILSQCSDAGFWKSHRSFVTLYKLQPRPQYNDQQDPFLLSIERVSEAASLHLIRPHAASLVARVQVFKFQPFQKSTTAPGILRGRDRTVSGGVFPSISFSLVLRYYISVQSRIA